MKSQKKIESINEKHKLNSMRIYVTEKCNASCPNCYNSNSRSNREMSIENFEKLCGWLKSNGITHLKLLGGEPTVHSNFNDIVEIAQSNFNEIAIFSNGIEDKFKNIKLRDNDSIIYNFSFNKEFTKEKFHLENGGKRAFEVQVRKDSDENDLATNLIKLVNFDKTKIHFAFTLDCTSNIFEEKEIIVPKLQYLEKTMIDNNLYFTYDHKMPFCYLYKTGLHPENTGSCDIESAAVIDSNLNLRYCLQYSDVLVDLYRNNKFVPWQILMNHLYKRYYELRLASLNKICLNCIFYNSHCNGGCWIPKEKITKHDILEHTDFPTI